MAQLTAICGHDPGDAAICRSVIALAHAMQLRGVGAGAQAAGQLNCPRRHHCDQLQGDCVSRPLPAPEYEDALVRQHASRLPDAQLAQPRTLLMVDDEPNVLAALQRSFRREGFRVLTAASAAQGLELLAEHPVQVVLSDERMPAMSGTQFLSRVRVLYPDTIRIILSGDADFATVVDAVSRGTLFKFLSKPWQDDALRELIREAFVYHESRAVPDSSGAL